MESKNSYLSAMIKNARKKRNFTMSQVYSGICSEATYARFEGGDFDVNVHVRGAIMQRLGINEGLSGMCINAREYAELDDREHLLEYIGMGDYKLAREKLEEYINTYNMKKRLNRQFVDYVQARLEYVDGQKKKSLELYESAIKYTMPHYETCESIVCISVYEAYIMCEIAELSAELGDIKRAENIYMKIIEACQESNMNRWIRGKIYPKAANGILRITNFETAGKDKLDKLFEICDSAFESLRQTMRLYFARELLIYRNRLCIYLHRGTEEEYNELCECLDDLYSKYNINEHNYEWYPYYINGIFYPVDKFINERRMVYGITVEELAGAELDVGTVSRIINGKNMPRRSTIDILFKRLDIDGAQYSYRVISENFEVHQLWDDFLDALLREKFDVCEQVYSKLKDELDTDIYINRTMVDWMRIKIDFCAKKITYFEALERYKSRFEKIINNADKLRYCAIVEHEVIGSYIDCLSLSDVGACVDLIRKIYNNFPEDIVQRKREAAFVGGTLRRFASYIGDTGNYEESSRLAHEGINFELSCAKAYLLGSYLYGTAWNHAMIGALTKEDVKNCRYAYLIAWFVCNNESKNFYKYKLNIYREQLAGSDGEA